MADKLENHLPENLRYLCAEHGSTAQVCREMGINQQQFSKYLSGRARPSSHNLRKIARFFGLRDEDLQAAPEILIQTFQRRAAGADGLHDPFFIAFPGSLRDLRRFLGLYQTFNLSPAIPGCVVVAVTLLEERGNMVYSRTVDAIFLHTEGTRYSSHFEGKAAYHGERIFIVEFEMKNSGSFMLTTLFPPHRYRKNYLFGMTSFLASHPVRMPYSSRTVWKRLDAFSLSEDILRSCGEYPLNSSAVGPTIRKFLQDDSLPVTPPFDL